MRGKEYTAVDINRRVFYEASRLKCPDPYEHLNLYREGLRTGFGPESPIFQNICEGIFYALSRASMGHYIELKDLYDIEDFVLQMAREKSAEIVANFVHGYIVGIAYIEFACENAYDIRTLATSASRLLHAFTSPAGSSGL